MSGRIGVDTTAEDAVAVTPSDSVIFVPPLRGLYIGSISVGATLTVVTAGGNTVQFTSVVAGTFVPVACAQVKATGTAATNIVGFKS